MNTEIDLENLNRAQRRALLDLGFTQSNANTLYKVKKHFGLAANASIKALYERLGNIHNSIYKSKHYKSNKQNEHIKKQLYVKELNRILPLIEPKKKKNHKKVYNLLINLNVRTEWGIPDVIYIYEAQMTILRTFVAKNVDILKTILDEHLSSIYPLVDTYKITYLVGYDYKIRETIKNSVHKLDVPMRVAKPYIGSFLTYMDKVSPVSLDYGNGECVLEVLCNHWKVKGKPMNITNLRKKFQEASEALYNRPYYNKWGISSRMIEYVCKQMNTSCLGFDQNNNCFVKYTQDNIKSKNYKAIIFYMFLNHFYLIDDDSTVRHISQCFKESTSCSTSLQVKKDETDKKKDVKFYSNLTVKEGLQLSPNSTIIYDDCTNLNEHFKEYVTIANDAKPVLKYSSLSSISKFVSANGIIFVISGCRAEGIQWQLIKQICDNNNIEFNNQSFGNLLLQLKNKFNQKTRISFSENQRKDICDKNDNLCCLCSCKLEKQFHIDHIKPLANGGTNDDINLQALCPTCHRDKCQLEQENCDYIARDEIMSYFNLEISNLLKTNYFRKVAFTEYLDDSIHTKNCYGIDMIKCRRNLLINSNYNYCVFSVLDNIEPFNGIVQDGIYYVECENRFPMRGNIFYTRPIVEYALSIGRITKDNIKYQILPSFKLANDYFKSIVEYLLDVFKDNQQLQKFSINSLIGLFGRRNDEFIKYEICNRNDNDDMASVFGNFTNPCVNVINDDLVSITGEVRIDKIESCFPIHMQVLDEEAIELHKLSELIKDKGGKPILLKTDCVIYENDEPIDLSEEYWDEHKQIKKYKNELFVSLVSHPVKIVNDEKLVISQKEYNELQDNDNIISQIIQSQKGLLILGSAGTGKTYLLNKLVEALNDKNKLRLAPTNVSALLINGQTLNLFMHAFINNRGSNAKYNKLEYVFVDEISMVREQFYQLLLSLKLLNPNIKFIISGDFYQLPPVADRVVGNVYETSQCLYQLVDGNRLCLTKCKRSDDVLYNICESVKLRGKIDISGFGKKKTLKNISFTNNKRKLINSECVEEYLRNYQGQCLEIPKLHYDKNSQAYTLTEGMPLIARINKKTSNICNNEVFRVKRICSDFILVTNEVKDELKVLINDIPRTFHLAFCITVHKSQGQTFNEDYTIYEWNKMDSTLKYVSLSRATDIKYINIV